MRQRVRCVVALAWVLAIGFQTGLAAVHAHASPEAPGFHAARAADAAGGGDRSGRHDEGACAVCKSLVHARDLQAAARVAAPPSDPAGVVRTPSAGSPLLPVPPLSQADPRAPPSGS
jgi:hypothetical protein